MSFQILNSAVSASHPAGHAGIMSVLLCLALCVFWGFKPRSSMFAQQTLIPLSHLFSPETMSFLSTHACFLKLIGAVPRSHYHAGHSHLGRIIHLQCDIVAHHEQKRQTT